MNPILLAILKAAEPELKALIKQYIQDHLDELLADLFKAADTALGEKVA